jgi:signal transduction histidine kinase
MPQLFNAFRQLQSSGHCNKSGTGLGLAISKAIIEQHGGTIGVNSEASKGTTFWFELATNGTENESDLRA